MSLRPCWMSSGSLVLPLPDPWRISTATLVPGADGSPLARKPELHVTLLDSRRAAEACQRLGADGVLQRASDIGWNFTRSGDAALLRDRDDRRGSLVEWLQDAAFDAFREQVAADAGISVARTRAHLTHFASDARGIGLPDMAAIKRLHAADLRLPAIGSRTPRADVATVRTQFEDGCSVLAAGIDVHLGRRDGAIDDWLATHRASTAVLFSAADPFGEAADTAGNRVRTALLHARLEQDGLRRLTVAGREDDDEALQRADCVLDPPLAALDALMRDYEQLAVVLLAMGEPPALHLHPALQSPATPKDKT